MKKVFIALFLAFTSLTLMACEDIRLNQDSVGSNEVTLVSMVSEEVSTRSFNTSLSTSEEENDTEVEEDLELDVESDVEVEDEQEAINYQYKIVDHNQEVIDIKISLDNPNNYYIYDFEMTSNNAQTEILIDNEYAKLDELDTIRWNGATNHNFTISIKLNSTADTELTINNIYYSDRATGTNTYTTDLNNMNEFVIYNVKPLEITFDKVDSENNFIYSVSKDDRVTIDNLTEDNKLVLSSSNETIEYHYTLGNIEVSNSIVVATYYNSLFNVSGVCTSSYYHLYFENIGFEEIKEISIEIYVLDENKYAVLENTITGMPNENGYYNLSEFGYHMYNEPIKFVANINGLSFTFVA